MGANPRSRHAVVAQGSPAACSPTPDGDRVITNHHAGRLKVRLEIEAGRSSTAVSRLNWLMAQKLEHCEQRMVLEELLDGMRQESDRVERLEQAIRDAVPE